MANNPDVYLLYEYMKKNAFTVRIKVDLPDPVDEELLNQATQEAITRFPYFSVRVALDEGENYILLHNDRPLPVLPETDKRLMLGSEELDGHLFAITWKDDSIWFNWAHCLCGGFGAMYIVKTTMYQYLTKKYGEIAPPSDLKAVGSPVDEAEYAFPDPDALPFEAPLKRYEEGDSNIGLSTDLLYFVNPFANDVYYYQVDIESKPFMEYAKKIDGTPNSVLAAVMLKATARYYMQQSGIQDISQKLGEAELPKGTHISAKIADDYRKDLGCGKSYRDFVRFIHVRYDWEMEQESIEKLSQRARGAIITQMQPENSYEWYRQIVEARKGIDSQPDLKSKIKYAQKHSIYKSDSRDTFMISYVGKTDWGGMADYIRSLYTITDGNLMLEVNALPDKFCVTFQMLTKDRKPLDHFCDVLREEQLPFTASDIMVRNMPDLQLPNP